jgi:hypothetical protein
MQEGEVQAGLGLERGHLWQVAVTETYSSWRLQEQTTVGIESGGLGRIDNDLCSRRLVGNIDCSRAVFCSQARVASQQLSTRLFLLAAVDPPLV